MNTIQLSSLTLVAAMSLQAQAASHSGSLGGGGGGFRGGSSFHGGSSFRGGSSVRAVSVTRSPNTFRSGSFYRTPSSFSSVSNNGGFYRGTRFSSRPLGTTWSDNRRLSGLRVAQGSSTWAAGNPGSTWRANNWHNRTGFDNHRGFARSDWDHRRYSNNNRYYNNRYFIGAGLGYPYYGDYAYGGSPFYNDNYFTYPSWWENDNFDYNESIAPTYYNTVATRPMSYYGVPATSSVAATTSTAPIFTGNVSMKLQQRLAQAGYYHGPIDGIVGIRTRAAILAFQRDNRMPQTARIDVPLLRALGVV